MMNAFLIATMCANFVGPPDACQKTLEAASRQAGTYQYVDKAEDMGKSTAQNNAKSLVGVDVYAVTTYAAVAAKAAKTGSGSLDFKAGFCDKISVSGSKDSGSLNLNWKF